MKLISRLLCCTTMALLGGVLAGCAATHGAQDSGPHAAAPQAMMDMQSMCEMHKKMMSGKTPAERQAMMDEYMKSMPPEMRQRMQMMHGQCQ
jgi:hypothetical protein